jgi:nitrite reductase/ring-hydroxylating ferredoxin subunit
MTSNGHDIGNVADFDSGRPYRVDVNGRALVVVRRGQEFFAIRDVCPHQGARLSDGRVSGTTLECRPGEEIPFGRYGEILICPWHGWEYDLQSGQSLFDPQGVRVASYSVSIQDDRVIVHT